MIDLRHPVKVPFNVHDLRYLSLDPNDIARRHDLSFSFRTQVQLTRRMLD
jgi:hypothetical protein